MSRKRFGRWRLAVLLPAMPAALASTASATELTFNMSWGNPDTTLYGGSYSYFKTVSGVTGPQTQYHAYGDNVATTTVFPVPGDP